MHPYLFWLIAGFILVIIELLTGTFYLLVLGIAAFGATAVAWYGFSFPIQSITAVTLGLIGSWLVHNYRSQNTQQQMRSIDYGQPVIFEAWLDQGSLRATVMYRGAPWEAQLENSEGISAGSTLYIKSVNGNILTVSKTRPQ